MAVMSPGAEVDFSHQRWLGKAEVFPLDRNGGLIGAHASKLHSKVAR